MIDKYIYKFLSFIDGAFAKVDEVMTFDFPNCKKKKKDDEQKNK
jgi:hypothetical protein